jgi:retron-type reverse transcriptase
MIERIASLDHLYRTFVRIQLRHWDGHPSRSRFPTGADGESLPAFAEQLDENLRAISSQLLDGSYTFSPFRERRVILTGGKEKRFSQAGLRDTLVQKATASIVEAALDRDLPDTLHAFRRRRAGGPGLHAALSQAAAASQQRQLWVLQEDIQGYFDHIRHDLLLESLEPFLSDQPEVLQLYSAYLQARRQANGQLLPREQGIPIGSVLANFLANVYLLPLDRAMALEGFEYARYCDDILVLAPSEAAALRARHLAEEITSDRGLTLNAEKSALLPPGAPFVYLGYEFDGPHLRVGSRAMHKFKRKVQRITARRRWPRLRPAELASPRGRALVRRLVKQVNQLVAGNAFGTWPRYFARAEFDDQFRELDRWIRRRIRAALLHRWRESDARYLPARQLQDHGLKSLVGEHWRWRQAWREKGRSTLARAARLDQLREGLRKVRARSWDPYRRQHSFRPGPDGVTLDDIAGDERAFLLTLQAQLIQGQYRFGPFVEYGRVRQGREDLRWIARPGLADSVVARALAANLAPLLDSNFPRHVYAYRPGKGSWAAVGQLRRWILATSAPWVVRADASNYLDCVQLPGLEQLLDQLLPNSGELDLALRDTLRSYLWSGRWRDEEGLLPRERGLPRGGPLTPLLGNLYLLPLDQALAESGFRALRYADDVAVVASSEDEAQAAWELIQQQATELGLELGSAKSGIIPPDEQFEFLGYRIAGSHFDVRPYAVNRLKRRVRRVTRRRRWQTLTLNALGSAEGRQELARLVSQVNRLLVYGQGLSWSHRFARCSDDSTFRELDLWIADRVRACVTGRWSPRNRRLVPDALLRELGLARLVRLYYHARRRIAGQAARAALARQIASSPEAGR